MLLYLIPLLICASDIYAHEFIQKAKPKRMSLYQIKEQTGQAFAQQLQDSAQIVELLGRLQTKSSSFNDCAVKQLLQMRGTLKAYAAQLKDTLTLTPCSMLSEEQTVVAPGLLLAELTEVMGAIQQQLIKQLNDLLEDSGSIFLKKNLSGLQHMPGSVSSYTKLFQDLKAILCMLDKPIACKVRHVNEAKKEFSKS